MIAVAKVDPRLGAPLTLGGAGLFLFAVIITTSLLGDNAADAAGARLMLINVAIGLIVILGGRLRPLAVAIGLGAMVVGQAVIAAVLIQRGIGLPAVVGAVAAVLAVPLLLGAVLATAIVAADRRSD